MTKMNRRSMEFEGSISKWANLLIEMVSKIKYGNLKIITPEGKFVKFSGEKKGEEVSVRINDWRFCEDIFLKGDIGLGESYISGYWDCKDISKLIKLGIDNYKELERVIKGSLLKIVLYRIKHFFKRNSKKGSKENIFAHYDIGNDFFKLWLDPSMTYSSAIFENFNDDLFVAQENKYEKILKNLNIKAGDHILEIGCGWGGFMEHAAKKGIKVTGVTISEEQYNFAKQRLKNFGNLSNIKLLDYREVNGSYDHIVSIEMVEALGESYWKKFFQILHSVLKPGGKVIIQSITINNRDFYSYRRCSDFIQQYIFPGGMLPSPEIFISTAVKQGFDYLNNIEFGRDYGLTLRKWEENFSCVLNKIKDLGFDEKFIRTWRFYLKYCQGGFESKKITVSQFQFAK